MLVREDTEGLKHKRKKIGALHIIIMKISCSKLQRQAENWETNKQTKLAKDLSAAYGKDSYNSIRTQISINSSVRQLVSS